MRALRLIALSIAALLALAPVVQAAQTGSPQPTTAKAKPKAKAKSKKQAKRPPAEQAPAVEEVKADATVAPQIPKATPHSTRAEVTPFQAKLGEPFTITIEVLDRPEEHYELGRDFSLGPDVDLLDTQATRTPTDDGLQLTRFTLRAALFELGAKTLPTLRLQATGPSGDKLLEIDGPSVTGVGVVAEDDESGYADILPPVQVRVADYLILWILLGVLVAVGLFFALMRLWKHLRARPRKAPAPKPLDPLHVRALAALHALRAEDLPSQGREREMFFRLSEIERGYLGERYGFDALDMTTEELLAALGRLHTPGLNFTQFELHCREGDFVRFAKAIAPASLCKRAIEEAITLVQTTTASVNLDDTRRDDRALPTSAGTGVVA
ncbi:MAG: hypothetical protein LBM75_00170 [Myxococcales bacterium]|jgi:hypothetical protein|nr:hypothetical protein [Myxococcales bacterium]